MSPSRNRTNAAWLRAQLDDLRFSSSIRSIPVDELQQALANILEGKSWREART